jgi:hypothetical protein
MVSEWIAQHQQHRQQRRKIKAFLENVSPAKPVTFYKTVRCGLDTFQVQVDYPECEE